MLKPLSPADLQAGLQTLHALPGALHEELKLAVSSCDQQTTADANKRARGSPGSSSRETCRRRLCWPMLHCCFSPSSNYFFSTANTDRAANEVIFFPCVVSPQMTFPCLVSPPAAHSKASTDGSDLLFLRLSRCPNGVGPAGRQKVYVKLCYCRCLNCA